MMEIFIEGEFNCADALSLISEFVMDYRVVASHSSIIFLLNSFSLDVLCNVMLGKVSADRTAVVDDTVLRTICTTTCILYPGKW